MSETGLPVKNFNLLQFTEYRIDFQVIQHYSGVWIFGLNFCPEEDHGLIKDGMFVDNIGIAKLVQADVVVIHSKQTFSQWEYAAEAAVDAIEAFGFDVETANHVFNVLFWNPSINDYVSAQAEYSNQEFKLLKE